MPFENDDDRIRFNIEFALKQYKYKPPPRFDRDPDARDRYYRSVANAVLEQLKLSFKIKPRPYDEFGRRGR